MILTTAARTAFLGSQIGKRQAGLNIDEMLKR